jgi:ubiquinone/menaquinone biosynthesis C-methylase UbiE
MDDVHRFNRARWNALARANALFTRPWLNETAASARHQIDPAGRLGDLQNKDVLCLAGGGGQQSAAFALNGARVTVFDISEGQLSRDDEAARHYGYSVATVQGDMRNLSMFRAGSFDIISQPYSLNFVPDCRQVFAQVARALRTGGLYSFWTANPFAAGLGTHSWNGVAYEINRPYEQGTELQYEDESWVFPQDSPELRGAGPREYRQILSTILNGLVDAGFTLIHMQEETGHAPAHEPAPGTWDHFTTVIPPWFSFLARRNRTDGSQPADQ